MLKATQRTIRSRRLLLRFLAQVPLEQRRAFRRIARGWEAHGLPQGDPMPVEALASLLQGDDEPRGTRAHRMLCELVEVAL